MNKHDLTASEIYAKERSRINDKHPALYALAFVFWAVLFFSLVERVL